MPFNSTLSEVSFFVGLNLHGILYGIELCLYFRTMHIFLARRRACQKSDMFYAVFSSVMFVLVTIWIAIDGIAGREAWLTSQNYPGGPIAYEQRYASYAFMDVLATVGIILQQLTDGLMIYRCRIVWDSLRVIIIPFILWLGTLSLGILTLLVSTMARSDFFSRNAAKFGLAYYSAAIFLHTTLTSMICYRLACHAKATKKYLGEEHAAPYLSIMRLLVESVLPLTLAGIAFLISYGVGSPSVAALSHVYELMLCVSPQMLILRVAKGSIWNKDSMKPPLSVMMFPSGGGDTSASGDVDGSVAGIFHVESSSGGVESGKVPA